MKAYIITATRVPLIRMVDIDSTKVSAVSVDIKTTPIGVSNWSIIPNYFFNKCGGLNFLLRFSHGIISIEKFLNENNKFMIFCLRFPFEVSVKR